MKRFLTLATTAALVLGSTNAVAFGSTFADINNVPWPGAATFIEEAASLGLMSGYTENGNCFTKQIELQTPQQRDLLRSNTAHVLHHENILQTERHKRYHHQMETHYGCVQNPLLGI